MEPPIGTYNPPATRRETLLRMGTHIVQPLADKDGGIANAVYEYFGRDDSYHIYRLTHVDEWMPPMSPQEKATMFTDAALLPPLDEHGRIDYKAIAERRRREWAIYR